MFRYTNLHFFLVDHCHIFSHNQPFRLGRGGCTWPGGGCTGGRGDARASCASPLGTPLPGIDSNESILPSYVASQAGMTNRIIVPSHQNQYLQTFTVGAQSIARSQSIARTQSIARRHTTYVIMQKNLNFVIFCLERLRRRNLQGGSLKKKCFFAFKIVK